MSDMNYNWAMTDEQRYRMNENRIRQLKDRLAELRGPAADDELFMGLAAQRARAFDMAGSDALIGHLADREAERLRSRQQRETNDLNRSMSEHLKMSELIKGYQQAALAVSNSASAYDEANNRSLMNYYAAQIRANGGQLPGVENIRTKRDVLAEYWDNTTNTKNGRVFKDNVSPEERSRLVEELRINGEMEKADELEKMPVKPELIEAQKKEKAKRAAIQKAVKDINDEWKKLDSSTERYQTAAAAESWFEDKEKLDAKSDSLVRNFPEYVTIENGRIKYKAKD